MSAWPPPTAWSISGDDTNWSLSHWSDNSWSTDSRWTAHSRASAAAAVAQEGFLWAQSLSQRSCSIGDAPASALQGAGGDRSSGDGAAAAASASAPQLAGGDGRGCSSGADAAASASALQRAGGDKSNRDSDGDAGAAASPSAPQHAGGDGELRPQQASAGDHRDESLVNRVAALEAAALVSDEKVQQLEALLAQITLASGRREAEIVQLRLDIVAVSTWQQQQNLPMPLGMYPVAPAPSSASLATGPSQMASRAGPSQMASQGDVASHQQLEMFNAPATDKVLRHPCPRGYGLQTEPTPTCFTNMGMVPNDWVWLQDDPLLLYDVDSIVCRGCLRKDVPLSAVHSHIEGSKHGKALLWFYTQYNAAAAELRDDPPAFYAAYGYRHHL